MSNQTEKENEKELTEKPTEKKKFKRIPFRKQERIGVAKKKGIYTRLVNDEGARISRFLKAGFAMRENSDIRNGGKDAADASQFGNVACQNIDREGNKGYYMDIPEKVIQEDIEYKEQETIDLLNEIGHKNDIPEQSKAGKVKITLSNRTEVKDHFRNPKTD